MYKCTTPNTSAINYLYCHKYCIMEIKKHLQDLDNLDELDKLPEFEGKTLELSNAGGVKRYKIVWAKLERTNRGLYIDFKLNKGKAFFSDATVNKMESPEGNQHEGTTYKIY